MCPGRLNITIIIALLTEGESRRSRFYKHAPPTEGGVIDESNTLIPARSAYEEKRGQAAALYTILWNNSSSIIALTLLRLSDSKVIEYDFAGRG